MIEKDFLEYQSMVTNINAANNLNHPVLSISIYIFEDLRRSSYLLQGMKQSWVYMYEFTF